MTTLAATLSRRSLRPLWLALAAAVTIAIVLMSTGDENSGATTTSLAGPFDRGHLAIDGTIYEFTPETCFSGPETFVGSGAGSMDGTPYWISASPSVVEITFGISEEAAPVPDGARWLRTTDVVSWRHVGDPTQVAARVSLVERANPDQPAVGADFWMSCVPNS